MSDTKDELCEPPHKQGVPRDGCYCRDGYSPRGERQRFQYQRYDQPNKSCFNEEANETGHGLGTTRAGHRAFTADNYYRDDTDENENGRRIEQASPQPPGTECQQITQNTQDEGDVQ